MIIAVTGSNGYIGKKLTSFLQENGHHVKPVSRKLLYGNTDDLAEYLVKTDAVINLAGAPILQRWTPAKKDLIYQSRVQTTKNLIAAINILPKQSKPKVFISASAVGIYKNGIVHNENSTDFNNEFVGQVVQDWEKASDDLATGIRRVIFRLGVVLGKESQTIKKILPVFKLGVGGNIGNGKQAFPYIHIEDLISAFNASINEPAFEGTYNLVTPQHITNAEFTKALAKTLNKPAFISTPAFALKMLFGKAASLMLDNPIVHPKRLIESNFQFKYPTIKACFSEICGERE